MANKKTKYKKITASLKDKLRVAYVQGELDTQGFRKTQSIEELATNNNLSKNTLYKLAQRENWKFQQDKFQKEYQNKLDNQRLKEFSIESKKFLDSLSCAVASIATILSNMVASSVASTIKVGINPPSISCLATI